MGIVVYGGVERELVVGHIPALRAFARTFVRDRERADDLVQETLVKALANLDKFQPGTRMKSWLFTIMRNTFYTEFRRRNRETPGDIDDISIRLRAEATQEWTCAVREMEQALGRLPAQQRQVLILIGVGGVSYEEASEICGCAVGTIKSRLNRARATLLRELGENSIRALLEPSYNLSDGAWADEGAIGF
jgi:RNA polymerase sigma-70 factor (ECF subfamily)